MDYVKEKISVGLKTQPVEFVDYRIKNKVNYHQFDQAHKDRVLVDIWEKSVAQGQGWLGVIAEPSDTTVAGDFTTYLHIGCYDQIESIIQKIMTDYPQIGEFYLVYLNSPQDNFPEKPKTKFIFR